MPATSATDETTATATASDEGTATAATAAPAIVPYICVHDAAAALAWYADAFGAVETIRYTGDDGRIGHAEMVISGARLMLSDEYPDYDALSPRALGGTTVALTLQVGDVDAVHARAVATGATSRREPADEPYGERSCTIIDPFGHKWMVQTPIATPTVEQVQARTEGFTITTPTAAVDEPGERQIPPATET